MKTTHPVIFGINTHKASHVAVAIDAQGTRLAALSIPTNPNGYLELERCARSFGKVMAFGIEGTGSYGAGLSRSLVAHLKRILGLGRLRLRGPCGANDGFLLAATAQNLRKLAKMFPALQQMRRA